MGKILDLHTLAELQVFTAPYERTGSAMRILDLGAARVT
jgi:hypothetical protein